MILLRLWKQLVSQLVHIRHLINNGKPNYTEYYDYIEESLVLHVSKYNEIRYIARLSWPMSITALNNLFPFLGITSNIDATT